MPAGSNRVKVKASTNSSSGTPYCRPTETRDGEVVHHRPEARAFLVHVDEDLAQAAIGIFAGAQIDLVAADDGLLRIALAALGQLFAVAADDFLDDHLLDDLFGDDLGLFLRRAAGERLFGLFVILDQRAASGWLSFDPSR
jgi:hypothetical protein